MPDNNVAVPEVNREKLQKCLSRLEVNEPDKHKSLLDPLLDYKVAILADDSGSMRRGFHELLSHDDLDPHPPKEKADKNFKDERDPKYHKRIKEMKNVLWELFTDAEKERWKADKPGPEGAGPHGDRTALLNEKQIQLSRFKEVEKACRFLIDICGCYRPVDLFFFNRPGATDLTNDKQAEACFTLEPSGETQLIDRIKKVVNTELKNNLPVLLFILTDGHPDGTDEDRDRIKKYLCKAVGTVFDENEAKAFTHQPAGRKSNTMPKFRVQMMHCTEFGDDTDWLDELDEMGGEYIDAVDDYNTELHQVINASKDAVGYARKTEKDFTLGDWVLKAIIGPLNKDIDRIDEGNVAVELQAKRAARKAKLAASKTLCSIL